MSDTTATASVPMTAEQAGSAIEAMLSGMPEDQQEQEALSDEESQTDEDVQAAEEDAADDDTDVEESDEEVDEEEQEQPQKFTVKVDGKDVEVTLDELQKGYSRTEDYTRKTQALAQERKQAQAEFEQVRHERAQYAQLLGALQQQLQQAEQSNVDMERLYQEDPIEWVRQRELQRVNAEKLQAIQFEQQRLAQENQKVQSLQLRQRLEQEKDLLLSAVPELKDPKVAAKAKAEMMQAGKAIGLTDQELNSITDHRFLLALRKIAQYDSMVAKRQAIKPAKAETPTAKPGLATRKPVSARIKQSQQRLKSTGNVRDAASLIANLL